MSNRSASSSSMGREIFGAFLHPDVAGGAGVVAAAGVVERDVMVQRDVEDGLFLAVIFVGQFAVLELHGLAFGQKRDLTVFSCFRRGRLRSMCRLLVFFLLTFTRSSVSLCVPCVALPLRRSRLTCRGRRRDTRRYYSNSAFAMGCGAVGPSPRSVSSMFLPFSADRNGGVHHQFGKAHRALVQRVDGFADRLIVFLFVDRGQRLFHFRDLLFFVGGERAPGRALLAFFERGENRRGFGARFDQLAVAEIFFRVVERVEDHAFDLLVGQAVAGLDLNLGFFAAALLARGNVENAVGVDQEFYFDARNAGGHGRNAFEIEAGQRAAVFGQFAFALQHVDGDVGLAVDLRGVVLRGRRGDGRVAQDDFVGDSAGDFDAERERSHVEQQHVLGGFGAAAENVGLHGRAQGDDFVGIQIGVRLAVE